MTVFDPVQRTILILEDDRFFQDILTEHSKLAVRRLKADNLIVQLKILRADNLQQALQILAEEDGHVDILSVDVNLGGTISSQDEVVGGFGILEKFKNKPDTLSIVVSGENQMAYPLEAFQTYGVLNYIFKAAPDMDDIYIRSVQTALWYLTTLDCISMPLDKLERLDLERAEVAWNKTIETAQTAKIRVNLLPQQLSNLIQEHRSKYVHPDTELPVDEWSYAKLRRFVIQSPRWMEHEPPLVPEIPEWTILRCRLHGYDSFITRFSSQKQALMRIFSHAITSVTSENQAQIIFVGHLDRDLFQSEPQVLVIFKTIDSNLIERLTQKMQTLLAQDVSKVFPSNLLRRDINPGDYQMTLGFKTWTSAENHDFSDLHATLDELNRGEHD
jgi:hypothetical protein